MKQKDTLAILFVEDDRSDVELTERELARAGMAFESQVVETAEGLMRALQDFQPDLVISDYALPQFDGMQALQICRQQAPLLPFIVLTGSMNEETAVACMKAGASDYVLKERLTRLPFAVSEVLERTQAQAEREAALAALRISEERFRVALSHSSIIVAMCDRDLRYIWIHEPHPDFDPATVIGRRDDELAQNDGTARLMRLKQQVLDSGASARAEIAFPVSNGVHIYDFSAEPLRDVDGQIIGVTTAAVDITRRRQREERLRLQATMLNSVGQAVIAIDLNDQITYVNRYACALYGWTPEEVLGKDILEVAANAVSREQAEQIRVQLQKGEPWGGEFMVQRQDGVMFAVLVTNSPIIDEQGRLALVVSVSFDISERKQAEEALRQLNAELEQRVAERTAELTAANVALTQASRLKDEFLANMSHELRTPLSAVLALSEALQRQVYGPLSEKQIKSLRTIHESGQHLLSLINDILDLSKIEAGKLELQIDMVSADQICQASLGMVKEMADNKRQQVCYTNHAPGLVLRGDGRRLTQALVNLLGNAVKFTPVEGELGLEVQADAAEQAVRFTVWDRGIGMAAETLAQLFQPFVQLDAGLNRQHGGTGLGLALVRRLVEMHGGGVQVESQVGAGSRFTVSLPWQFVDGKTLEGREHEGQETWQQAAARAEAEPRGVTVLLVEDTEATLRALADYLDALGYRVLAARSGAEALRSVRAEPPDLILLDIQMPVMDGLEVIRRLRADADPRVAGATIVALTALVMPGDRERCLAAGADEYLAKPVALDQLVATIERLAAPQVTG